MICYKCGAALGSGRVCLHCGTDVTIYRKIVRISNSLYNSGLEKAKIRDLSGAISDLTRSLEYDKNNIRARNLLGLVYFEMGEVVDAISHWVISKDIQPLDNIAETYIEEVKSSQQEYEAMGIAIKKYNVAIEAAKNDGEDMAIIQLKSAINEHPRHIKSYCLLTLLFIKTGEYSKANKVIKKGLQIDRGNILLQKYAQEISGKANRAKARQSQLLEKTVARAKEDVIVPKLLQKDARKKVIAGIVATFAICLLVFFFLIKPSYNSKISTIRNQNQIVYNEKAEDKDIEIQTLKEELAKYKEAVGDLEKYSGEGGVVANYELLLSSINSYFEEAYDEMAISYAKIDPDVVTTEAFKKAYERIGQSMKSDAALDAIALSAFDLYEKGDFDGCLELCDKCLDLNPNFARAIYYKGLAYEGKGDSETAKPYFQRIVDEFPDTTFADYAEIRLA